MNVEHDYKFGILSEIIPDYHEFSYKYIFKGNKDQFKIVKVYVDTNNNPMKYNKMFSEEFNWNHRRIAHWIEVNCNS